MAGSRKEHTTKWNYQIFPYNFACCIESHFLIELWSQKEVINIRFPITAFQQVLHISFNSEASLRFRLGQESFSWFISMTKRPRLRCTQRSSSFFSSLKYSIYVIYTNLAKLQVQKNVLNECTTNDARYMCYDRKMCTSVWHMMDDNLLNEFRCIKNLKLNCL